MTCHTPGCDRTARRGRRRCGACESFKHRAGCYPPQSYFQPPARRDPAAPVSYGPALPPDRLFAEALRIAVERIVQWLD